MNDIGDKDDELEEAVRAVGRMVRTRIERGDRESYAQAERLCAVGQTLRAAVSNRVDDLEQPVNEFGIENAGVIRRVGRPRRLDAGAVGRYQYDPDDAMELQREAVLAAERLATDQGEKNRSVVARNEADELARLLDLSEGDRRAVSDRIEQLKRSINERSKHADVVSADTVRGHSPRADGPQDDAPHPDGAFIERAPGPRQAS